MMLLDFNFNIKHGSLLYLLLSAYFTSYNENYINLSNIRNQFVLTNAQKRNTFIASENYKKF